MNAYGQLLSNVNPASLVPHPSGDGFLIQTPDGQNLSVNSNGELKLTSNEGIDEKWQKGDKCMFNLNTFGGNKYFFLEWF